MWWSKKDGENATDQTSPMTSKQVRHTGDKPNNPLLANPLSAGRIRRNMRKNASESQSAIGASASEDSVCLAATTMGVEVSLPGDGKQNPNSTSSTSAVKSPGGGTALAAQPFSSVHDVLSDRKKVYRAQFATSDWSVKPSSPLPSSLGNFSSRNHRVPLFKEEAKPKARLFLVNDAINLLKQHNVSDELECVKSELTLLNVEISALKLDRDDIERKSMRLALTPTRVAKDDKRAASYLWETHRKLMRADLAPSIREELQDSRGTSLTVCLHNEKAQNALQSSCGHTSLFDRLSSNKSNLVTISPSNCGRGGAAKAIQHMCLLSNGANADFFLSKDSGKNVYQGRLPDSLLRRMQTSGRDSSELLYLSTGPLGSYYAEFRSGQSWWGTPERQEDSDFHKLCQEWDVNRVAFGPCASTHERTSNRTLREMSWVILSRNGRAAWKNIPARLHRTLESRMASEASPAEISLGFGDSYFVRFLDDTVDYCLAKPIAEVIEKRQLVVTAAYLHPELPNDYILRHR